MSKVILKNVRLSFPSLFHKASYQGQETKFEATFLIPSDNKMVAELQKAIKDAAEEKFGVGKVPKGMKSPLIDGNEKDYSGYEGMIAVKASSSRRVTIINKDKTPIAEEDNIIYAGCYVNAIVETWVQSNDFGKRVNFNLLGVQFVKDGESFVTGSADVTDDFDEIEDDDDSFLD